MRIEQLLLTTSSLEDCAPNRGVQLLGREFRERGISVTICALSPARSSIAEDRWHETGCQVVDLGIRRTDWVRLVFEYRNLLNVIKPQIVHSSGLRPDLLAGAVRGGCVSISTVRNCPEDDLVGQYGALRGRIFAKVWYAGLRQVNCIVPHSCAIRDNLVRHGLEEERMAVIRNGVDVNLFAPPSGRTRVEMRNELGIPADAFVIGYVGRLVKPKDVETILRAYALVPAAANTRLLIIGDGSQKGELEDLARMLGISARVIWTGFMGEVHKVQAALDLFCLASLSEGLSRALLEAGAMGIPAVVSDIPGNTEFTRDGVSGVVCPATDATAFGAAFNSYIECPSRVATHGQNARIQVEAQYSANAMVDGYLALYEKSLQAHSAQRIS